MECEHAITYALLLNDDARRDGVHPQGQTFPLLTLYIEMCPDIERRVWPSQKPAYKCVFPARKHLAMAAEKPPGRRRRQIAAFALFHAVFIAVQTVSFANFVHGHSDASGDYWER
jgi:hypothetical protein